MSEGGPAPSRIEPSIWSSVVRNMLFPLNERQVDTRRLLRESGISTADLEHPHNPIAIKKYLQFMESAAREAGDPLLGLRLANACGPEILGALGFLFLSSKNLLDALNNLCHYETLLQDVTHMSAWRESDELWFSYELFGVEAAEGRQDIEFSIAFSLRMMRIFTGGKVGVKGIQFRHDPSVAVTQYESLLGAGCAFRCDNNAIRLSIESADIPGKQFDPNLLQILREYLDVDLEKKMNISSFADQLRRIVHDGHIRPPITAQKMADYMGLSTSTLNRRLRSEGVSFKALVDEARFELARAFLSDSSMTVIQISQAIGFASAASFSRAFCRWSDGVSPRAYRNIHQQPARRTPD